MTKVNDCFSINLWHLKVHDNPGGLITTQKIKKLSTETLIVPCQNETILKVINSQYGQEIGTVFNSKKNIFTNFSSDFIRSTEIVYDIPENPLIFCAMDSGKLVKFRLFQDGGYQAINACGQKNYLRTVLFSKNKQLIATASTKDFKLWELNSLDLINSFKLEFSFETSFIFVADDSNIITWGHHREIYLRELETGKLINVFSRHKRATYIGEVIQNPITLNILSVDDNSNLYLWDYLTGNVLIHLPSKRFKKYGRISTMAFTSDGLYLAIGFNHPSNIVILETESLNVVQFYTGHVDFRKAWCIYSITFDKSNDNVYSMDSSGNLCKWKLKN